MKKILISILSIFLLFNFALYSEAMVPGEFLPESSKEEDPPPPPPPSYKNDIDSEEGKTAAVEKSDGEVGDAGDASGETNETVAGINANQQEIAEEEAEGEKEQQKNLTEVNDKKDKKNSEKKGDPVRISSGYYEQTETDFSCGNGVSFELKRQYESDNKIVSSFGYGWKTNLDERIILGIDANVADIEQKLVDYCQSILNGISHLEAKYAEIYGVSSIYSAKTELDSRISSCASNYSDADGIVTRLTTLEPSVAIDTEKKQISNAISNAKTVRSKISSKKGRLEAAKNSVDGNLAVLADLRNRYDAAVKALEEFRKKIEEIKERKKRNEKAMFSGMEAAFEETGLNTVIVIDAEGFPHILFENKDKTGWSSSSENNYIKCMPYGNGLRLYEADGHVKDFDSLGFLVKITDRNGNNLVIHRDESEQIESAESSYGEHFDFEYKNGFISKVANIRSPNQKSEYTYNGKRLFSVTDIDGDTVSMEYNEGGRLTALNKCDGSSVSFSYNEQTSDGKILATATTNEEGFSEYFEYNISSRHTIYIDHDGNKTSYWYDDRHRTVREECPDGSVIKYEYADDSNPVSISENGNLVRYGYDGRGNLIWVSYEDGSREYWTYDTFGLVTSYTDRDGVQEEYLRDEKGNEIEYRRGGETVYSRSYDSKGQVIRQTIYSGNSVVTDYEYDDFGNVRVENCGGVKKEYEYDEQNRVTEIKVSGKTLTEYEYDKHKIIQKKYNGLESVYFTNGRKDLVKITQKDSVTGAVHETRLEYDRRHLPVRFYIGDGETEELVRSYSYTPEGKLHSEIMHGEESWIKVYEYKNGQISEYKLFKTTTDLTVVESVQSAGIESTAEHANIYIQKINYSHDSHNRKKLTVTDALGIQNLFEYDSYGNLIKVTDGIGEVCQKSYTRAGRLSGEQSSYGGWYEYVWGNNGLNSQAGEKNKAALSVEYFPDGSKKVQTDRYGKTIHYTYDLRGRLASEQGDVRKVWYEYDDLDRLVCLVVGDRPALTGAVYYVSFEYSEDGRSVTVTEGGKYKSVYELDAFGNVVKQIDGNTNERSLVYSVTNQLVESYDGYKNKSSYEYNSLGQVSKQILPDGVEIKYHYNYMGLPVSVTDSYGIVYEASYDKAGRLIKERNRADVEKSYEYDKAGRVTRILCGGEVLESYTYYANSRTVIVKDGRGENYIYNYDDFGRLINERNRNLLEQNYFYDDDGKLKSKQTFDGSTITINWSGDRTIYTIYYDDGSENRFVYDMLGNILESENCYGKSIYRYDQGGRLVYQKELSTDEEISFDYDQAGNRIKLSSTNMETKYVYGKNNEIKEIFDNKQRISIKLEYDKNGREVLRRFGNGTYEETLYDKAGRVTVKMQKSARGDLLWGEGYAYAEDGKRMATVDNQCRITFYEYNKTGRLETVYYPYTQDLEDCQKKEAEINGLITGTASRENRFISSEEKSIFSQLLNSMQYGLSYHLPSLHILLKESYKYDKNGNRVEKQIPYGKIEYTYDKENCLLTSGSNGQAFITYSYDSLGNLIKEESKEKTVRYAYNSQSRMIFCEVADKSKKEYVQTIFAYDAFGRRVSVKDKDQVAIGTLYDGLTFDVIKQSPVFENGVFTDSKESGIKFEKTGRPTGDRYRFISDNDLHDGNRYLYLDESTDKTVNSRYRGERLFFSANGSLGAQVTTDFGSEYFSTDLLGSISCITDSYGDSKSQYTYDVFGNLIQGNFTASADFGYLSKQHDSTASLYNYGYRDYQPQTSRFTTSDPIRDGSNWFAYCDNDPVNFIDLWGLEINNFFPYSSMSKYDNVTLNNTDSLISSYGCAITGMANIITEIMHVSNPTEHAYNEYTHEGKVKTITPIDLNVSSNFQGNSDCLNWNATANVYGLEAKRSTSKSNAQSMLRDAETSKEQNYVLVQVPITIGSGKSKTDVMHWVGHSGNTIKAKGTTWVEVVATSANDATRDKKNSNWMNKNGKMYVKQSAIEGVVIVNKTK